MESEGLRSEGEHEGLARTFREKVISLDTMELRLVLPTAIAIAVVVAGAILLAVRELPWPLVSTGTLPVVGTVPLPVAILAAIAFVIAWSFILTGALHAHLAVRVVALGVYALLGLSAALLAGSVVSTPIIVLAVSSVVVAAAGLYLTDHGNRRQAPHLHHRIRLRLPTFGWVLLATTLIYALLALSGLRNGRFTQFMDFQLAAFSLLLVPVLVLAGTDFAEWAEVASGRLGSALEQLPRPALLGALAAAGAGVLVWTYLVQGYGLVWTLESLAPVALLALPLGAAAALSLRRPTSTRVPFWALAVGAVVVYAGLFGGSLTDKLTQQGTTPALPPMVAATRAADPGYWLLVPQGWRQTQVPGGRMWSGSLDGRPARLLLLWGPLDSGRALASALAAPVELRPAAPSGGWSASSMTATLAGRAAAGEVWTRREADRTWVLAGVEGGGLPAASRGVFETVRDSWAPDATAGLENSSNPDPVRYLPATGGAAIALLGLGFTLLLVGGGEVATGGLFLALCGLFAAGGPWVAGSALLSFGIEPVARTVGTLSLLVAAAYLALPVAALMAVGPGRRIPKPCLRLLLVLLLGLVCLQALREGVFGTAQAAGARFSVIGAVVLVAALLWDVLMSGESFTNTGGLAVPRHTRVLIYLGYTVIVVTAVVYLASEQVQGGGGTGYEFPSELWPQVGIETLGPPLLLTFFLVNLAAWRRGRMGRPDGLDQVDRSVLDEAAG